MVEQVSQAPGGKLPGGDADVLELDDRCGVVILTGVGEWEESAQYLTAKLDQTTFVDPERGRAKGMRQFLDDKSYKPGLDNHPR